MPETGLLRDRSRSTSRRRRSAGRKASRRVAGAATDVLRATSTISLERRAQRPVAPPVERLLDDEPRIEAELGQCVAV